MLALQLNGVYLFKASKLYYIFTAMDNTGCSKKRYTRALFGSPLLYLFTDQVNILEPGR